MKICTKCKKEKPYEEFHRSEKRGYQAYCIQCRKEHDREYWKKRKNDLSFVENKKQNTVKTRQKAQEYIYQYLLRHPCVDCAEKDPIVLTFDHVCGEKLKNISDLLSNGSLIKIQEEIEKCVVRCANCHMKKTAKDFNWFTFRKTLPL